MNIYTPATHLDGCPYWWPNNDDETCTCPPDEAWWPEGEEGGEA